MQNVSQRFLTALSKGPTIKTVVEVWANFGTLQLATLYPSDGAVTESIASAVRRNLQNLTLTDTDGSLVPLLSTDPLTPYGNELFIYSGVDYGDGTSEVCPVGVYPIIDVDLQLTAIDLGITVGAQDRSAVVARRKLPDYYVIPAGTDLATAIRQLIQFVVPQLTSAFFSFATTTAFVTPLVVLAPGADPWAEAQTLASSAGFDLYFNQRGICTLVAVPDPQLTAISRTYNVDANGPGDSLLEQLGRKLTSTGVTNHIVVQSSGTGIPDPIRADAWDDNPQSPTYIGPFYGTPQWQPTAYGDVVAVVTTSTATTQAMAQAAADAALNQALGLTATGTFAGISNPAHLVNDVIGLQSERIGYPNRAVVLNSITLPLGYAGSMSGSVRLVAGR